MVMTEIDKIFDEECCENIFLFGENGEKLEFEQIAVLPIYHKIYVILRPVGINTLADDEALVFCIDEIDGEQTLVLLEDEALIDDVFSEYYNMLRQEGIDVD